MALQDLNLQKGQKVLDLGCGNGRLYELLVPYGIEYYGVDLSDELVKIAKKNVPDGKIMQGDITDLPYEDSEFDLIISVATLHHIPSKEKRLKTVQEMHRVLKSGGEALTSVWYFWDQWKYVKQIIASFFAANGLDSGDFMMSWKTGKGELKTHRYFHAWRKTELRNILKRNGFNVTKLGFYKKRNQVGNNLITIAKKL